MHNGYLALGGQTLLDPRFEVINNGRTSAYIANFNAAAAQIAAQNNMPCRTIAWYNGCDECFAADDVFSNGQGYQTPESDPAPWYDPYVPDSRKFFGVIGLEIEGSEDSTRSATVVEAMTGAGGGVVGRLRFAPRTMVVRALAVALDDCGMEVGLNWLRCQYETSTGPVGTCVGDYMWFLDCCPDCNPVPGSSTSAPCWADNYIELLSGPADCPDDVWWPSTYAELLNGPPPNRPEWCAWIDTYYEMLVGLPQYACSSIECIEPHVRQYVNTRIVEGPTILSRKTMNSIGEIAEIEFTIVAADPHEYAPYDALFNVVAAPTVDWTDPVEPPPVVDPFQTSPIFTRPTGPLTQMDLPTQWRRTSIPFEVPVNNVHGAVVPRVQLSAGQRVGPLRIGLWADDELIDGYVVPFLPANTTVDVDAQLRRILTDHGEGPQSRSGFLTGFAGRGPMAWERLPRGEDYTLTIDQPTDDPEGMLGISLYAATQGCA